MDGEHISIEAACLKMSEALETGLWSAALLWANVASDEYERENHDVVEHGAFVARADQFNAGMREEPLEAGLRDLEEEYRREAEAEGYTWYGDPWGNPL